MRKMLAPLILGFMLALIVLLPLRAHTPDSAPAADTKPTAANPVPAGQAPDEVMKKLSELVHAGKYAEAQQLTAGLLMAYPDDQRLIKVKALLDKPPANAAAASPAAGSDPHINDATSAQPTASTNAGHLTGMESVDYDALIELAKQAQQTTDLPAQRKLLQQFMDQSCLFLQRHPTDVLLWQLRAAAAISLNDAMAGYEAGQRLLLTGVADGADPNVRRMLAQLKNKGWLDKQGAEKHAKYDWLLGTWSVSYSISWPNRWPLRNGPVVETSRAQNEEFSISGSAIEGYEIADDGVKSAEARMRGIILDSGDIRWEKYYWPSGGGSYRINYRTVMYGWFNQQAYPAGTIYYPSGFVPVISFEAGKNKATMTMVIPSQDPSPTSKNLLKDTVTLLFTKIGSTP
jgi:hypothetical protein